MDASSSFLSTLISYLIQTPVVLVWFVALVLSAIYWRRHPRVSSLTVIAVAILLVETLVNTFLNLWLPLFLSDRGMGTGQIAQILAVKAIVTGVIVAVAWAMVVAAIFGGRRAAPKGA
jgi:hypothetical protein